MEDGKAKSDLAAQQARSVVQTPTYEEGAYGGLFLTLGSIADDTPQWGADVQALDWYLRALWPSEPILASAIYTVVTRNAAFNYRLTGSPRSVDQCQEMFHRANNGKGWLDFIVKWATDYLTQNNGAHVELVRLTDSPTSPVIGFNHLDSCRCRRTGVPDWPIVYTDRLGIDHKLKSYQVYSVADMPSPIETMNGVGMCAVTRLIRECKRIKDIAIREREHVQAADPNVIYLLGNVARLEMDKALKEHKAAQNERGFVRYIKPLILPTLDPKAAASMAKLELSSLRENYSKEEDMKWYIVLLAMALGCDYQDFAPLPGGGLGTSNQSQTLHQKSRGKGSAMFQKTIEHMINFSGMLPRNVEYSYDEQDVQADLEQAQLELTEAQTIQIYISSGVLTVPAARQILLDRGYTSEQVHKMLGQQDKTPEVTVGDAEPAPGATTDDNQKAKATPIENPGFAPELRMKLERKLSKKMEATLKKAAGLFTRPLRAMKAITTPGDLVSDADLWGEFNAVIKRDMIPAVDEIMREVLEYNIAAGMAFDFELVKTDVASYARQHINDWAQHIEETTREQIQQKIIQWEESGLGKRGMPDLVKAIEDIVASQSRADLISTTETGKLFDEANRMAEEAAGVAEQEWVTAEDEIVRECPICWPLNGKRFPINEGPRPGPEGSHFGCRCNRVGVGRA